MFCIIKISYIWDKTSLLSVLITPTLIPAPLIIWDFFLEKELLKQKDHGPNTQTENDKTLNYFHYFKI